MEKVYIFTEKELRHLLDAQIMACYDVALNTKKGDEARAISCSDYVPFPEPIVVPVDSIIKEEANKRFKGFLGQPIIEQVDKFERGAIWMKNLILKINGE